MDTKGINEISQGLVINRLLGLTDGNLTGYILSKFRASPKPKESGVKFAEEEQAAEAQNLAADTEASAILPADSVYVINEANQQIAAAQAKDIANTSTVENIVANNGIDPAAKTIADTALSQMDSLGNSALGLLNPVYAAAVPLCIIYNGSVDQSGPTISSQTTREQNLFDGLASQADEQKNGTLVGNNGGALANAIGATNSNLGDYSNSYPEILANGGSINTSTNFSPEAGSSGGYYYDIFNLIHLPGPVETVARSILGQCYILTNPKYALATGLGMLVINFFTDGEEEAALQTIRAETVSLADAEATSIASKIVSYFTDKIIVTDGIKTLETTAFRNGINRGIDFVFPHGVTSELIKLGGVIGLTTIAKVMVMQQAGINTNGLAQKNSLANEALSGAMIQSNELNRSQTFGRPLTKSELIQSNVSNQNALQTAMSKQNAYNRYASLSNPYSFLSRTVVQFMSIMHFSSLSNILKTIGDLLNPLNLIKPMLEILSPNLVLAASNPDPISSNFGILEFGWSNDELSKIDHNPLYSPLENQIKLDTAPPVIVNNTPIKAETYIAETYGNCFGYQYNANGDGSFDPTDPSGDMQLSQAGSLGSLLANPSGSTPDIVRDSNGYVNPTQGTCSPQNLSYNNPQLGDLVFRFRLAMAYDTSMNQLCQLSNGITTSANNACLSSGSPAK